VSETVVTEGVFNDRAGEWFFRSRRMRSAVGLSLFIGWAAKTEHLGDGPLDVDQSRDDVHFDFADTPDAAIRKLKSEVLS
jgi:hypothetical protein